MPSTHQSHKSSNLNLLNNTPTPKGTKTEKELLEALSDAPLVFWDDVKEIEGWIEKALEHSTTFVMNPGSVEHIIDFFKSPDIANIKLWMNLLEWQLWLSWLKNGVQYKVPDGSDKETIIKNFLSKPEHLWILKSLFVYYVHAKHKKLMYYLTSTTIENPFSNERLQDDLLLEHVNEYSREECFWATQFSRVPHLESLNEELGTHFNRKDNFHEILWNLTQITHLSLTQPNENIDRIPPEIWKCTKLQMLTIYGKNITSLPESIWNLKDLWHLDLHNNQISSLPDSFCELTNLAELTLSNNQLTSLPANFWNLWKLELCYLDSNNLTSLPELKNNHNLQLISLSDNKFTSFPEALLRAPQITSIGLSDNALSSLPEWITKLPNLQSLIIAWNKFTSVPKEVFNIKSLTDLFLGNQNINFLPSAIQKLSKLEHLTIQNTKIKELPEELSQLENLKTLTLHNNKISSLWDIIWKLPNLEDIDIEESKIDSDFVERIRENLLQCQLRWEKWGDLFI